MQTYSIVPKTPLIRNQAPIDVPHRLLRSSVRCCRSPATAIRHSDVPGSQSIQRNINGWGTFGVRTCDRVERLTSKYKNEFLQQM